MATQTAMQYSGMGGLIAVTVQFDDVSLVVGNIIFQNLTSQSRTFTLTQGNKTFSHTVAANTAQTTIAATRNAFTLTLDAQGVPEYNFTFTVTGA